MVENLALQVTEVWCWGPVTLCNFHSNLSRNAPRNETQEVCAFALVKNAVKLRDKLLEGWYTVQWYCQLLQSVAKSRVEFYSVQRFAQHKNCEATHVTLCNSPATCLATALRDELLRKLHNVTGPLLLLALTLHSIECMFIIMPRPYRNNLRWRVITHHDCTQSSFRFQYRLLTMTTFF